MKKLELFLMILKVPIDFLMLILAALSAYAIRSTNFFVELKPILFDLTFAGYFRVSLLVATVWIFIFILVGLYSYNPNRKLSGELKRVLVGTSLGLSAIALYMMLTITFFDSRFLVLVSWFFAVLYVSSGRILVRGLKGLFFRLGLGLRRVVVLGKEQIAISIIEVLNKRKELGYKVMNNFSEFGEKTENYLKKNNIDELLFINPRADEKETMRAINFCAENQIIFKYSADLFSTYSSNVSLTALAGVPIVELKKTKLEGWWRVLKRIFDIFASLLVLLIVSPLMLISAIIIFFETGMPIIYKNERVGLKGKKFFVYKFRSMYKEDSTGKDFGGKEAEKKEMELIKKQSARKGPIYKIANDPRVTKFGKFLRRWSLDELPQFFNVLKGEMSIVGPRPHQPREVEQYKNIHKAVFFIKPGITGLSQISGRSDLSYEEELNLDLFYIENWNFFGDMIISLKTPFIIFKKRKAL